LFYRLRHQIEDQSVLLKRKASQKRRMDLKRRMQLEFSFTSSERQAVLSTGFVGALILFMFAWRTTDYVSIVAGVFVFLLFLLLTFCSVFLFVSGAKIIALRQGYRATYALWTSGLLVGFVI
jgi:hypothetical protein